MHTYFKSLKNDEQREIAGKWLINESIENNYFDFIQLMSDHSLWFLWVIYDSNNDKYNNNNSNDRMINKQESLLQFLHNQCIYYLTENADD